MITNVEAHKARWCQCEFKMKTCSKISIPLCQNHVFLSKCVCVFYVKINVQNSQLITTHPLQRQFLKLYFITWRQKEAHQPQICWQFSLIFDYFLKCSIAGTYPTVHHLVFGVLSQNFEFVSVKTPKKLEIDLKNP